jgi:uncharacterized protein YndB with AHSA1/START domain
MGVTGVTKDPAARTMTLTAEWDATPERAWRLWADPRRLERWWGPPEHPATVTEHDLRAGGRVAYVVAGAGGDTFPGWWHVLEVDPPRGLRFELGDPGIPPLDVAVRLEPNASGGTTMTITTTFPSDEAMDQLVQMGFAEGLSSAVGQADALLLEPDAR